MSTVGGGDMRNKPRMARRVENRLRESRAPRVDVTKILTEKERSDKTALIAALEKRLLQSEMKEKQKAALRSIWIRKLRWMKATSSARSDWS